jgi:tyrosinase
MGFGGNGTGSDGCVADGPFKNIKLHMSNHYQRGDSFCLSRNLDQSSFDTSQKSNIEQCFGYANYTDAWYDFLYSFSPPQKQKQKTPVAALQN